MRNILILLLAPILVSCLAPTATTLVVACSSSEKEQSFPPKGAIKKIDLSLTISDKTNDVSLSETAVCEYQGSICVGGAWFDVWYGDQSISHNIPLPLPLPLGDELVFWPHSFCTTLDEYSKQCKSGNCDPVKTFKLQLMFSDSRKASTVVGSQDWTKGKSQDRALVKASDLPNYGYQVKHFSIEIVDESL